MSKHEAHTVVADASYPHEESVSARHEEQSVCVEHTDVVDVLVVVAGQPDAVADVSSTQDPETTVHPYAALHMVS